MANIPNVEIRRYLMRKCAYAGVPVSGIFELTPRCNLKCKMCYVRLTPEQMAPMGRERTAAEWLSLAQGAAKEGMAFLLLTGGEPTLRQDFEEIYEGLAQMGLSISINSNGTLISDSLKALWHRLPPAQVNVTLYGVCREDYAALCGNPAAFDAVEDGLRWLRQEGILVHLNTTITPTNQEKWLALEEYAKNLGLELRMTAYCFPPARRSLCDGCADFSRLTPEAAGELLCADLLYQQGPEAILLRAHDLETPLPMSCEPDSGKPIQCMAGKSQFWVTWNSTMTPCGMLPEPAIPLEEGDFAGQWAHLREECGKIRLCPDCAACPHQKSCMNCAAATYSETGRFDGKPEYMCRLNQAYRQAILRLAGELENAPQTL